MRPQIIVTYDRNEVDRREIEDIVLPEFDRTSPLADVDIVATNGLRYYQLKNLGAELCRNEVVVFVDSDVIPEEGWLSALLDPFRHPDVQFVAGSAHVSLDGRYSKTFALFWMFRLRVEKGELRETRQFGANNLAVRRGLFRKHQFPEMPLFRGQCRALAESLQRHGVKMLREQRARVAHPAPNGLKRFICKALSQGYDREIRALHGERFGISVRHPYWRYGESLRNALRKIRRHYRDVHLSPLGAVAAFGIAATYLTIVLIGRILTRARPDLLPRYLAE